jgi:hypothetical protein
MSEQPTPSPKLRISPLGCIVVVVAVLFIIPVVVLWAYRANSSARVENLLAAARARGEPTSPEELEEYYSIGPGATNPATLWLAAVTPLDTPDHATSAGDLPIVGTGQGDVPLPGEPWPLEEKAEQHLARYASSLEQMHEAAAIGGPGRYPTEFSDGLAMLLPHAQALRSGARLLNLDARMAARRGDAQRAAQATHAMFMASESLAREPILISQLVRFAISGVAVTAVEDILPAVEFSDEDLALLQRDLEMCDSKDGVERSLLGERVIGTATVQSGDVEVLDDYLGGMAAMKHGLPYYLESMEKYHGASKKPWPQAIQEAAAIEQNIQARASTPMGRIEANTAVMLAPALDAALQAGARAEAANRTAATAIAIERYRRKNGRLPAKLEQLVPEFLSAVPADPFDGKPLRYVVRENGVTVYSIGRDRADNGGEEKDQSGDPDVAFSMRGAKQ